MKTLQIAELFCYEKIRVYARFTSDFDIDTWLTGKPSELGLEPQGSPHSSNLLGSENNVRSQARMLSLIVLNLR